MRTVQCRRSWVSTSCPRSSFLTNRVTPASRLADSIQTATWRLNVPSVSKRSSKTILKQKYFRPLSWESGLFGLVASRQDAKVAKAVKIKRSNQELDRQ